MQSRVIKTCLISWFNVHFMSFKVFKHITWINGSLLVTACSLTLKWKSVHHSQPFPFLSAYVLYRGARQEELRHLQNVLEAPPWLQRWPVPGGRHHLCSHSRLQFSASRTEIHHQLCGLLRYHKEAFVQGRAVPRLSWLLGISLEVLPLENRFSPRGASSQCSRGGALGSAQEPATFFMNFGFISVFVVKWICVFLEGSSSEQWQMEWWNVCQRRKTRNVVFFFLFKLFLIFSNGRWNLSVERGRRTLAWGYVRTALSRC